MPIISDDIKARRIYEALLPLSVKINRDYGLEGYKVILFVGRLVALKNVSSLIKAYSPLKQMAKLVIIGDGECRGDLEKLSQKRAEALKNYLTTNEKVPGKLYKVTFGGENWDGLVQALEKSSMKDKDKFIGIIKNTTDDARRKQEIMRVDGGAPYRTMLKEIYPGLRKVNCKIDYTVANFDVEQGRVVIKVNPKYLSLNEMYQVANSYPKGSNDFVNVFDIAVRMYPNDEVANLNAAAVSLTKKDLENAIKYMDKANHQTAEFINNVGVYNFLNGDVQRAIAAFNQAAQMGNEAAKANLQQLQQILNMKKK